jgi:adenylate cyclase
MRINSVATVLIAAGYVVFSLLMFNAGIILPILTPLVAFAVVYLYQLAYGYILQTMEKARIRSSFRRYLDRRIADAIIADKNIATQAIGEKRHIAVLFVDVRGFTPLTESFRDTPEVIVETLNEYLELTTRSVFDNEGSVDKFIGDATMALFNGFIDQEDYVFKAVKAAWDMVEGAESLSKSLFKRLGVRLNFGVGVHCGEAVVGNLGPTFRKDYTAIGDTVNVAARLESNADKGQVLISRDVYDEVKDRIKAEPVGEVLLKGKRDSIEVFSLTGIL